jgi:hypothetical protein
MKRLLTLILGLCLFVNPAFGSSAVKIFDTDGVPKGLNIDSKGNISSDSIPDGTNELIVNKFGAAPDFDTGDNFVDVWDGSNDAAPNLMQYTWSTSALITQLSSSSGSDTEPIEIQGLDASYNLVVQTITLTGQTIAELTTPLIRVFRLKNVGTANLVGTVYCHETGTVSSGVPTTLSKTKAMITIGNNQTLMAIYTIPAGYTGYLQEIYANGANGTFNNLGQSIIKLFARPFGQVFQIKHVGSINSAGTSSMRKQYKNGPTFSEKTDIIIRVDSTVDASAIAAGFDIKLVKN